MPAAHCAAPTILSIATRESSGIRHYSSADATRLGQQHAHLQAIHRSSSTTSRGNGFQAAKSLRSTNPIYKTSNQCMSTNLLSASMSHRPDWNKKTNPKSNTFSNGFHNTMHEDTSLGSAQSKINRKKQDEMKKIQKHQERALLYAELIKRQEEQLEKKKIRRQKRVERYQRLVENAIKLQCVARSWLAKRRMMTVIMHRKNCAARQIQVMGNKYRIRKRCEARRRHEIETMAVLHIQFGWNQRIQRVEAKEELSRRKDNRARAKRRLLRDMGKERKLMAASMIQSMVRGWQGRKLMKIMEMEKRRKRRRNKKPKIKKKPKRSKGSVGPNLIVPR